MDGIQDPYPAGLDWAVRLLSHSRRYLQVGAISDSGWCVAAGSFMVHVRTCMYTTHTFTHIQIYYHKQQHHRCWTSLRPSRSAGSGCAPPPSTCSWRSWPRCVSFDSVLRLVSYLAKGKQRFPPHPYSNPPTPRTSHPIAAQVARGGQGTHAHARVQSPARHGLIHLGHYRTLGPRAGVRRHAPPGGDGGRGCVA